MSAPRAHFTAHRIGLHGTFGGLHVENFSMSGLSDEISIEIAGMHTDFGEM